MATIFNIVVRTAPLIVASSLIASETLKLRSLCISKSKCIEKEEEKNINVLSFGVAGVDYVATVAKYPEPDSKIRTNSMNISGGGNAANSAVTMQRLSKGLLSNYDYGSIVSSLQTYILTKVGNDQNGDFIKQDLNAEHVDTSHIVEKSNISTGFVYIIVDPTSDTRTCIATTIEEEISKEEILEFIRNNKNSLLNRISLAHFDSRHTYAGYLLASYINQMNLHVASIDNGNQSNHRKQILMSIDVEKDRPPFLDKLLPLCDIAFTNQTFTSSYINSKLSNSQFERSLSNYKDNNIECRVVSCNTDRCNLSKWHKWKDLQDTATVPASAAIAETDDDSLDM